MRRGQGQGQGQGINVDIEGKEGRWVNIEVIDVEEKGAQDEVSVASRRCCLVMSWWGCKFAM